MSASRLGRSGSGCVHTWLGDQIIRIGIWQNPLLVHLIGQFSTLPGGHISVGKKKHTHTGKQSVGCKMYVSLRHQRVSRNTRWCIFEVFAVTRRPPAAPCGARSHILRIIHNELSLVSSHGWYPSSMTLNSLNSLSSSQLVDRGPKFITTFHFPLPAYLIYDSINNNQRCRMPCHPQCPSCPLPACVDYHQLFSPLKLYLLISLSGPVTLFLRVMPRGGGKE